MSLASAPRDQVSDVQARPLERADDSAHADAVQPVELEPTSPSGDGPPPAGAVRPSARFMWRHPAHLIALAFGAGLSPVAAGTVGTLWAWLVWDLLLADLAPATQGAAIALTLLASWWAATLTARHLRSADPGAIVADEVVAFWLVLWLITPAGFGAQLAAFALFRFFDAVKPGPVGWADRLLHGARGWKGGWGILLDDLVAAFCTLLVIALWRAAG